MRLYPDQVTAARTAILKLSHCSAKGCTCPYCVAAHALRVLAMLTELFALRRLQPVPMPWNREWLERIEKLTEMPDA
jgi:hypothetical protein